MFQFARRYATSSKRRIDHSHFGLSKWPKSKAPSPHEIFGMDASESAYSNRHEFDKALKSTYKKLVKLYHPDLSVNHEVIENDLELLAGTKRQRFEEVQKAYEVLKDPRKRIAQRRYENTSFRDFKPGQTSSFEAYRMANAHRRQYSYEQDPHFWHAATWEDYYKAKWGRRPPTREEFEKNKWKILYRVLAVAAVAFVLQVMMALERAEEYNRQARITSLHARAGLDNAYNNYDEGTLRFQRIRRFLLYRRLGLPDRDDIKAKQEENDMLTRYAQQQVAKINATDCR